MKKEELSGGMSSAAHWKSMFSFFVRISLFTEKRAKNMERFVTAKEGDVQHFTDAASAKNTKASTNTWLNAFPDSRVVLLIHNSIICRAI